MDLKQLDSQYIWHPYTQMQLAPTAMPVLRGKGAWLELEDGRQLYDGISSWWVNTHGHSHPHINKRISTQLEELEHCIFAGFTHAPAVELASRLVERLPEQARVFYSDNGSTAVEVAIKMAFQYWHNNGTAKTKIVALDGAYHGDTFGAMAVSGRSAFNDVFAPYLFDVIHLPFPEAGKEQECIDAFADAISAGDVAAIIVEPLVQGASGMRMYSEAVLQQLMQMATNAEVLTIADEVFTGFGRTGGLLATNRVEGVPDIICLSKGLTGGYMALGVTTCKQFVYDAFLSSDKLKTFFHGHSFTANPIACTAANASLDLFDDPATQQQIDMLSVMQQAFAGELQTISIVENARALGTILAFELVVEQGSGYFAGNRDTIYNFFLDRGLLLRPLGNTVYALPPYCTTEAEMKKVHHEMMNLIQSFMQ